MKRIPTGILSLDESLGGGIPAGSLVLLLGEIGSGPHEFALTSSVVMAAIKSGLFETAGGQVLPEGVWWLSFSRGEGDLREEISSSFGEELYREFEKWARFKDFSEQYFSPLQAWDELLDSLHHFLREEGRNSLVILSELTDFLPFLREEEWRKFLLFLRKLQRESKEWGNCLIYAPLETKLGGENLQELEECADVVFCFEWVRLGPYKRKRAMYARRLRRLPSSLWGEAVFEISFVPPLGLQVTKPELIRGI
ncbi:MAG: RAD55 family ATPase [Candidatus Hadarchaeales archaeon]